MRAILCKVGEQPVLTDIETLEDMQAAVGGYIETVYPWDNMSACLIVNEEGLLRRLPMNRVINGVPIVGDCFAVGVGEEDFTDLPEDAIDMIMEDMKIRN